MPSKSQAGNRSKQESSKERLSSAKSNNDSVRKVCIWPVWSDSDVEKQEQAVSGRGRDKAKTSQTPTLYEDLDGMVLPPSLASMGEVCWKRPTEYGPEEMAVVKDPTCSSIDLTSNNTHIMHSKFVSWMVSEVCALWRMRGSLPPQSCDEETRLDWAPWAHIYPQPKSFQLNPTGKYYVKLFWMGFWRKVTIDDSLPYLDKGEMAGQASDERLIPLYPRTGQPGEIWPALLMKALLKVAALDAMSDEFGDFSVTHLLTGWVPQVESLDLSKRDSLWNGALLPSLPLWVRDSEENGQGARDVVVMACFRELGEQIRRKKLSVSSEADQTTVETTLKEAGLLPSTFDQTSPVFPLLLTQARNEPLIAPPSTPPPPVLQYPFYLGLTNRQQRPSEVTPPPIPPPEAPWFVEIAPREKGSDEESDAVWISYSDFLKCFSHLYIFRSPSSFKHTGVYVDLSKTIEEPSPVPVKKGASSVQLGSSSKVLSSLKENLLFVDSPQHILLHFVLSSLSNWREQGKSTNTVPVKTPFPTPNSAVSEGVIAGRLVVESFHWSSVQTSSPLLRVKSSGTRGVTLSLPPGRHVLKLHVKSPIGYHVGVFSHSEFHLTDDDNIYTALSKESSLYVNFCSEFIGSLVSATSHFGDSEGGLEASLDPLVDKLSFVGLTAQHANLLLACVLDVWASHAKKHSLTNSVKFAWKAFFYKSFAILEQGMPAAEAIVDVLTVRRSLSKTGQGEQRPSSNTASEASAEEHQAASLITRSLQRHITTRRRQSMRPGTEGNEKAVHEIEKSLPSIEPHISTLGLDVFRAVFEIEPSLKSLFPFNSDESKRCFSTFYTGSFPQLAPNSWALVLRAVFNIPTEQTMVPHFSSPVPSYLLRVINNDTMTELPRLFHATTPLTYTPNTHGYTVQVEAWCGDSEGVEGGGKWGLRLVSSSEQLPVLVGGEEELGTPHTQEVVDYCLPDRDNVLFRYTLAPGKDLPVSLHLTMSKQDACCKLQLLDNEECVCAVEGTRVCIIPLHYLHANTEEDKSHKYVVQAVVLRDSWPLADSAWPHISVIRSSERLEESKDTKPGSGKKSRSKGGSTKKSNTPSNAQLTQPLHNIDIGKPHWILRVSTNAGDRDQLTVAKDTEKADALQAMVQAWETEQPGRSQKALESRKKFLEARGVKDQLASEGQVLFEPVKIQQMDLSPFIINVGPPKLLDESELQLRVQERQKLFKDYRTERQGILEQRNLDREARNEAKVRQLEQAEQWQVELDQLRNKLNTGREAIRERHLKKEKAKEVEQQQQEEQAPPPSGRESKTAKGKSGKGKKK